MMASKLRQHDEEEKENNERWLLTYSDLMNLLLIFFIVLYSISTINNKKFNQLSRSLGIQMGTQQLMGSGTGALVGLAYPVIYDPDGQEVDLPMALARYIEKNGLNKDLSLSNEARGMVISVKDSVRFASGSADLDSSKIAALSKIAPLLKQLPNYIRIEGHTDDLPIDTDHFHSNWELSVLRATNVLQLLVANGVNQERVMAVGYADRRPLVPNTSDENRSKNRRVDIVIMGMEYNPWEAMTLKAN